MGDLKNLEIREKSRMKNVPFWMIAEACGISAGTFTVWMRKELPEEKRRRVLAAIDAIAAQRT